MNAKFFVVQYPLAVMGSGETANDALIEAHEFADFKDDEVRTPAGQCSTGARDGTKWMVDGGDELCHGMMLLLTHEQYAQMMC